VRTVKTQLTSVYKKCGVRSRSRLLALMMPRLSHD
jgi:DNA-binding CsgD family transcriptional regulator